ncbi:MAG TPA: hypothetical protein VGK00_04200 [Anaerolineales bacterium]|jgi:uncharacterized membrane protein
MSQILIALSTWLHALASIILIGHYLLLSIIYLPALVKDTPDAASGIVLSAISRRSRTWMYGSLAVFFVTGIHLMLVDPNYLGLGNFGNVWGVLMLVKHVLILGMLALGFWFNGILRVGPLMSSNSGAALAFSRFRIYARLMASAGVLVLLLTALAQIK